MTQSYGIRDASRTTRPTMRGATRRPSARGGTTPRPTGRTTPAHGLGKKNSSTRFFYGAIKLAWEGSFLPRPTTDGYEGRELDFGEAARGLGGPSRWKLRDRPTLVMVYDPSSKNDIAVVGQIDERPNFVAAAQFFNLVRVDRRSIQNKQTLEPFRKGIRFLLYHADGTPAGMVKDRGSSRKLLAGMSSVIRRDYGRNGKKLIKEMLTNTSRMAWVKKTIELNEPHLVCSCCGEKDKRVRKTIVTLHRALEDLKTKKRSLLRRRPAEGGSLSKR